MTIYTPEGVVLYDAPLSKEAIIHNVLMEDYYIELTFNVAEAISFVRGSYILYNGQKFEVFGNVLPEETASGGLRYVVRFEAQQSQMKRCKVFWRKDKNLEVSFTDTTSLSQFAALIVENVNAFLGGDKWRVGSTPKELEKHLKAVSFNGDSCWDAVNNIAETFDVEWWAEHNPADDTISLCFGKLEKGTEITFKRGDVVSSIPSNKGNESNYGTRFYVFGSTKNLPADYSSTMEGGVTNGIVEKRLHLPGGMQYIDARENLADSDIIEQVVFFDDIFPTNVETITSLVYTDQTVIEGRKDPVWTIKCEDSPLTLGDIIEGEQIQANFTSGDLIGQTFDIEIVRNGGSFDKQFKIVPKVIDAENGIIIPRIGLAPHVDDTFILIGVNLPSGRVTEAEYNLLEAGTEYAQKNSIDTDVCQCPTNAVYCHKNDCNYELGQKVRLVGDRFGKNGRSSRIQGYEKKLYDEYQATYTVGDNSSYSRLVSIEKAIQKSEYSNRTGLEANIIRAKGDRTTPSDSNIYSALAVESHFLNKKKGGIVDGATDFKGGLAVNGQSIVYNAEKGYWELVGDLIVSGAITMFGSSKGFEPSTITDAVSIDNYTIKKNSLGQLYVAVGGTGGGGGSDSGLTLNDVILYLNGNYYTIKQTDDAIVAALADYAKKGDIPSLSGYATESWVKNQKYATQSALSGVDSRLSAVETFFATDDTDNLVNKWSEIVTFLNATEGDTLDNILKTKANQSALDDAVASLTTEIGKKWTQDNGKISNWDTAFGWGDHSKAGYAGKSYVDTELAKYVKLATAQSISAQHDFTNGIKVGGLSITKKDGVLYLDANVVVSGAITMFGNGSTTFPTIWANIPFDSSMKWDGSKWSVAGGSGGGVDANAVNVLINEYLTTNKYATQSWVEGKGYITSSALNGYATQDWVTGKKYLTGVTYSQVTTALGYTPYNSSNPDKYIKGIDYDMVIAALGYTPYSTTNPMGYLTISSLLGYATEQWVGDNYLPSANFTKANIKSTLGISDWALAATKPSYTAAEVGALAISGGTISGNLSISTNGWGNQLVLNGIDSNAGIKFQYSSSTSATLYCAQNNPYWQIGNAVYNILHSGNIGSHNAGSADKLAKTWSDDPNYHSGAGLQLISNRTSVQGNYADSWVSGLSVMTDYVGWQLMTSGDGWENPWFRSFQDTGSWKPWRKLAFLTDNVASATKLQTARTIWGQSFDGSGNVDGDLYMGGATILHTDGSDTWLNYGGANDGKSLRFCGKEVIFQYGRGDAFTRAMTITNGGNVAVGRTTASAKLHVGGDLLTDGAITMFSQASLKNIVDERGLSLDELATIKPTRFYWKDGRDNRIHVGGIADDVMQVLPEVVHKTNDDKLTMDYGSAAFYIGASLIKPVIELWDVKDNHEKRIVELERENKRKDEIIISLQNQLKQLTA